MTHKIKAVVNLVATDADMLTAIDAAAKAMSSGLLTKGEFDLSAELFRAKRRHLRTMERFGMAPRERSPEKEAEIRRKISELMAS